MVNDLDSDVFNLFIVIIVPILRNESTDNQKRMAR